MFSRAQGGSTDGAVQGPCFAFVRGDAHALELFRAGEPVVDWLGGVRDRHNPFTRGEHRRLVHAEAQRRLRVADAELLAPSRSGRIRISAGAGIHAVLGRVLVAAIEDVPKPAARISPQRRIEGASTAARPGHRHGLRERLTLVVAIGEIDRVLRGGLLRAPRIPGHEQPAFRSALNSGNALPGAKEVDRLICAVDDQRKEESENEPHRCVYRSLLATQ